MVKMFNKNLAFPHQLPVPVDFLYDLGNPLELGYNNRKVFYSHRIHGICLHNTENLCLVNCFIPHSEDSGNTTSLKQMRKINLRASCQYHFKISF